MVIGVDLLLEEFAPFVSLLDFEEIINLGLLGEVMQLIIDCMNDQCDLLEAVLQEARGLRVLLQVNENSQGL